MDYLQDAMKPDTRQTYSSHVGMYRKFWEETRQRGDAFPIKDVKLAEFAIYLDKYRGLRRASIAQYISAVRNYNMTHTQPGSETVGLVLRAISNRQSQQQGGIPLKPAWDSSSVIAAATLLNKLVKQSSSRVSDMQSLAASIVGFVFVLRARSLVSVRHGDLQFEGDVLKFTLRVYKTKKAEVESNYTVPWKECEPLRALKQYLSSRNKFNNSNNLFLISNSSTSSLRAATQVNQALERVRDLLNLGKEEQQQSHALRRGAARAMIAIEVPLPRILSWGRWKNEASLQPYIEGRAWSMSTRDDSKCFGWMKKQRTAEVGMQLGSR